MGRPKKVEVKSKLTKKSLQPRLSPQEKIKQLIDAGEYDKAMLLMKAVAPEPEEEKPRQTARKVKESSCVAQARSTNILQGGQKIKKPKLDKNGDPILDENGNIVEVEHTVSTKIPFQLRQVSKPKFKDNRTIAKDDSFSIVDPTKKVKYRPAERDRDPAEETEYICDTCGKKDLLYFGPDPDMLYFCVKCLKKKG